jgi:uncharacterized membrane protein
MTYLVLGVLLWSFMHILPAVPTGIRAAIIDRTGEGPYKGLSGLLIIISIVLMVMGWRGLPREFIYELPAWADLVCGISMLAMSVLFFAPYMPTNIKRFLRHPQLIGIVLLGFGHVLASGQVRSLILFGGIGAWAIIEIILLNRRDGSWQKPEPVSIKSDYKLLLAGLGFFLLFVFIHEGVFGTSVLSA